MLNQMETEYLRACNDCAAACLQCVTLCLKEDDPKPMVSCILLDMECADMCCQLDKPLQEAILICMQLVCYVQKFVKNALQNVANMIWIIVNIVPKPANVAQLLAAV